jgi:hypothetical protein
LEKFDVVVVGAGVSGLIAACSASKSGAHVLILEKMPRAGTKLLITGKGRCNITNTAYQSEYYNHIHPKGKFLKHAFSRFFSTQIIELLNRNGVETVEERGGRVFPKSNKSSDVLQAMLNETEKHHVEIRYQSKVESLVYEEHNVKGVKYSHKGEEKEVSAGAVIISTGGKSYPATGSDGDGYTLAKTAGHSIERIRQSLVPLETKDDEPKKLQGLALKNVKAVVWVNGKKQEEAFGEMLFTHFGLSGPIILTLSRVAVDEIYSGNSVSISIDLKPALDEKKLDNRLLRDLEEHAKKNVENIARLWFPKKLIPVFFERTRVDSQKEGHQITSKERKRMKMFMKEFALQVKGPRSFKEAIITAGGVPTTEIDSKTMRSKLIDNLYFAGEVIDLDADTGGYNLQIAWSTGWLAGESSANSL